MLRNTLTFIIIISIVTSGCIGGQSNDSNGSLSESEGSNVSLSEVEYPQGLNEDGITNFSAFVTNNRKTLLDLPSLTIKERIKDGKLVKVTTGRFIPPEKKYYEKSIVNGTVSHEVYFSDNTKYQYGVKEDKYMKYENMNYGENSKLFFFYFGFIKWNNLSAVSAYKKNGNTFIVYNVTGTNFRPKDLTVQNVSGKVIVTESGRFSKYNITIEFNTKTMKYSGEVNQIGETNVDKPNWIEKAK